MSSVTQPPGHPPPGPRALLARPGLLRSSLPWRAALYLFARLPLPVAGLVLVGTPLLIADLAVGIPIAGALLAVWLAASVALSPAARRAVTLLGMTAPPNPHAQSDGKGSSISVRTRLREPATGREAAYALLTLLLAPVDVLLVLGWPLVALTLLAAPPLIGAGEGPIAMGPWQIDGPGEAWAGTALALGLLALSPFACVALAGTHARLVQALLAPGADELQARVAELAQSRLRLIDGFEVERRRIERDLHDGAQQQLVTLGMTLDLARIELENVDAPRASALVGQAHEEAKRTMAELRELIHAIHPPILADRGLGAALQELADRCPLPVAVDAAVPLRLREAVETAAYFVVSEALANAVKHSGANTIAVGARLEDDVLELNVRDDGTGGANAALGSGLAGLGDRVAAVEGRLTLSSPYGGPTVLRAEIPCGAARRARK